MRAIATLGLFVALVGCSDETAATGGNGGEGSEGGNGPSAGSPPFGGGGAEPLSGGAGGGEPACEPGATEVCAYSGPAGTEGVGVCAAGVRTCSADGSAFGDCVGEVLPGVELCESATTDENCDTTPACVGGCTWVSRIGATGDQYGQGIDATSEAIFITGYFTGEIDNGDPSQGGFDLYVGKLDLNGDPLWLLTFGDAANQYGYSVAGTADGGVVVTGEFQGTLDIGCASGALTSAGATDVFVAKLDGAGQCVWSKSFGDGSAQAAVAVAIDPTDGGVGLAGYFQGQLAFGVPALNASGSSQDLFFAKLSATGEPVWSRSFGDANSNQQALDVAFDSTGALIGVGRYSGTVEFIAGSPLPAAGQSAFTVKLSSAGTPVWAHSYGASSIGALQSLAIGSNDEIYASGHFNGDIDFGSNSDTLSSAGGIDAVIVKLGSSGADVWSRRVGGGGNDRADGLAIDEDDHVTAAGYFTSSQLQVPGVSTIMNGGGNDAFFVKLDPSGNFLWSQGAGSTGEQYVSALATIPGDGSIVATSYFTGTLVSGCSDVGSVAGADAFVLRRQP